MRDHRRPAWQTTGVFFCCLAAMIAAPRLRAQQSGGSSQAQTPAAAGDDNAFPEAASQKAADAKKKADQPAPDNSSAPDAPAPSDTAPAAPGAAGDNPFPEATSREAADAAKSAAADPDAGNAPPGVSSSSDYDRRSDRSGHLKVQPNVPMPHADGKDPVKEDLSVGAFYLQSGDYKGAYLRYKDAAAQAPENLDAIFGLASAAQHLNKRQEAIANYQLYLAVTDTGAKAKDARKALAGLGVR